LRSENWLENFTDTEKKLIETLQKLKTEDVELLWEIPFGTQSPCNDFIRYGAELEKEFKNSKTFVFTNADTYRYDLSNNNTEPAAHLGLLSDGTAAAIFKKITVKNVLRFLKTIPITYNADSAKIPEERREKIKKALMNYADSITDLTQLIEINASEKFQHIHEFKTFLRSRDNENPELSNTYNNLRHSAFGLIRLIEAEIIIKILASEKPYIIVYAGGKHCDVVIQILKKECNAGEILTEGISTQRIEELHKTDEQNFVEMAQLDSSVWEKISTVAANSQNDLNAAQQKKEPLGKQKVKKVIAKQRQLPFPPPLGIQPHIGTEEPGRINEAVQIEKSLKENFEKIQNEDEKEKPVEQLRSIPKTDGSDEPTKTDENSFSRQPEQPKKGIRAAFTSFLLNNPASRTVKSLASVIRSTFAKGMSILMAWFWN
jgi:hypothetical protein